MKFFLKLLLSGLVLTTMSIVSVNAHPGNTASDGCHYCWTNCDYWGVPWNVRHCHGYKDVSVLEKLNPVSENSAKLQKVTHDKPTVTLPVEQ